jgi:hypothetical protein
MRRHSSRNQIADRQTAAAIPTVSGLTTFKSSGAGAWEYHDERGEQLWVFELLGKWVVGASAKATALRWILSQ